MFGSRNRLQAEQTDCSENISQSDSCKAVVVFQFSGRDCNLAQVQQVSFNRVYVRCFIQPTYSATANYTGPK